MWASSPCPPAEEGIQSRTSHAKLIDTVVEVYQTTEEIKAIVIELDLLPNKVKRLLVTSGVLKYIETEHIQELLKQGKTIEEAQSSLNLSYSAINTYLPYSKVIYKMSEVSQNAERVRRYQAKKGLRRIV